MSKPEITVEIDENGAATVSVKGVQGKGCKDLTAELEKALGKVDSVKKTRDYAKPDQQHRSQNA